MRYPRSALKIPVVLLLLAGAYLIVQTNTDQSRPPHPSTILPKSDSSPSKAINTRAESPRPLIENTPLLGEISGAKWLKNQIFRKLSPGYEAVQSPPLDVLVNGAGEFIAACYGNDSFATVPIPENYLEVIGLLCDREHGYTIAPRDQLARVLSVKLKPADLNNADFRAAVFAMTANSSACKYMIVYPVEVQIAGESQARQILIRIWNYGTILEKTYNCTIPGGDLGPGTIPYGGPQIPGANRYAALAGIQLWQTNGEGGEKRFVTESWAGFCPWDDEQLDPFYGELLPHELTVPVEQTWPQPRPFPYMGSGPPDPPIPPEVKVRLDREAAEKAAAKNK